MSKSVNEILQLAEEIWQEYGRAAEEHAKKLEVLKARLEGLAKENDKSGEPPFRGGGTASDSD